MKYRQLTKEQLENLHQEFTLFLATQQIDNEEWKKLKKDNLNLVENEINIFSDIVWEDVLTKTKYLEHFSEKTINLFECHQDRINRIVITVNKSINLIKDFNWLLNNTNDDNIDYFSASKTYKTERNLEIFDLIEKGCIISEGKLFTIFNKLLKN